MLFFPLQRTAGLCSSDIRGSRRREKEQTQPSNPKIQYTNINVVQNVCSKHTFTLCDEPSVANKIHCDEQETQMAATLEAEKGADPGIICNHLSAVCRLQKHNILCDKGCKQCSRLGCNVQRASTAALPETYKGADPGANFQVVAYVSCKHTTMCDELATDIELSVITCRVDLIEMRKTDCFGETRLVPCVPSSS